MNGVGLLAGRMIYGLVADILPGPVRIITPSLSYFQPMLVRLDCSKVAWQASIPFASCTYSSAPVSKAFASSLPQLDHRPQQDGDADGNVLVLQLFCVPDRPAVGRCSDSKE